AFIDGRRPSARRDDFGASDVLRAMRFDDAPSCFADACAATHEERTREQRIDVRAEDPVRDGGNTHRAAGVINISTEANTPNCGRIAVDGDHLVERVAESNFEPEREGGRPREEGAE